MFRSSNPVLSRMDSRDIEMLNSKPMTVNGTIGKAFALILIAFVAAAAMVYEALMGYTDKMMTVMMVALVVGLISGLAATFLPKWAKFLAPVYAFAEGALLGGLSLFLEVKFPGIAVQAITGTFVAFLVMLFLYRVNAIRATEKFRATMSAALLTILILYVVDLVGGFFNFSIPFVSGNGVMAVAFSSIVVVIAALCLILDFDFIEKGAQNNLPKDFEWYGAFGLTVTLVWLYIEILKLIALLRGDE